MDDRQLATGYAFSRLVIGLSLLLAPRVVVRAIFGAGVARGGAVAWLTRALGVRDALLGVGLLTALREERPARQWLTFSASADAVDAVAVLLSLGELPARRRLVLLAAGVSGAASGLVLAQRIGD